MRASKLFAASVVTTLSLLSFSESSYACSRILDAVKGHDVLVARNMDWYGQMPTSLYVYPRGMERVGSMDDNPIEWTAKYGSIVAASYDMFTTDGFNEQGLGAHLLWLEPSDYGQRDTKQSGLYVFLWAQYYLDNFATVDEAVNFTNTHPFQILPFYLQDKQRWVKLHLAIEDASGDSAIIEYIDGKPHVYHDRSYTVMTNDPVYSQQLENLRGYIGFGGDKPLPGSASPEDRFVRASYYLKSLPQPVTEQEQMTYLTSVINNVAHPFEGPTPTRPDNAGTIWSTMLDLTHKKYYFKLAGSMGTALTDLAKFDLREGAPIMRLDLTAHPDVSGDVSSQYQVV